MKIGASRVVNPRCTAPISGFVVGISSDAQVSRQMNQPLLEADILIERGAEIGRIEQSAEPSGERVGGRWLTGRASDNCDCW